MNKANFTILERLARLEVLLSNHLQHHDTLLKWVLSPILVGVTLVVVKLYILK